MIHIVYGTRAELIKLSSIIKEMSRRKMKFEIVDLGQHDTEDLRKSLGLPKPHHYFGKSYRKYWSGLESRIVTYPAAIVLAGIWGMKSVVKLSSIMSRSDLVIVHGNTMGVPLTVYAVKYSWRKFFKKKPLIAHIESGVRANSKRSGILDWFYKIGDKNSDILVTTSISSQKNLKDIGLHKRIFHSGNFLKEIVGQNLSKRPRFKIKDKHYILTNSARSVLTKRDAKEFSKALTSSGMRTYFVINPVIKHRLKNFGVIQELENSGSVKILDPIDYVDFLHAMKNSSCVITDSNGVIEESAVMRKPCIVTNNFIQTPELERQGMAKVTGCDSGKILKEIKLIKNKRGLYLSSRKSKFEIGDGKATKRLVDFLEKIA